MIATTPQCLGSSSKQLVGVRPCAAGGSSSNLSRRTKPSHHTLKRVETCLNYAHTLFCEAQNLSTLSPRNVPFDLCPNYVSFVASSGRHWPRFGDKVVELVWENGQVLARGMPTRTRPRSAGYSRQNENEMQSTKRSRLGSVDSILGDPCKLNMSVGCKEKTPKLVNCLQDDLSPELFPELDLSNFNNSPSFDGSQVVPIHKSAGLQDGNAAGQLVTETEVPHLTEAWNSQINEPSQKQGQAASPCNTSVAEASPGPSPKGGELANSKLHHPYLGPEQNHLEIGLQNFSLFSTHEGSGPTRPTICQSSLRLKELKSRNNEEPPAGGGNPVESREKIPAACSLKSASFFHDQQDAMATKAAARTTTRPAEEPAPDEQSEAVVPKGIALSNRCIDPACGPTSCQASYGRSKGKGKMSETGNSTSICSRVASNDPTYCFERRDEYTEGMECPSDNDEEEQVGKKKRVSSKGKGAAKRRRAEGHDVSERRRRDQINKKIRVLKDLMPSSSKVDKESVLDKAIEYLKTLQLQVQMMSMGAGLFMPPMMFPPGIQHVRGPYWPNFSAPLGAGMRMHHMGVGCSPSPFLTSALLGLPGQGPAGVAVPREPFLPMMGVIPRQMQSDADTLPRYTLDPEWPTQ